MNKGYMIEIKRGDEILKTIETDGVQSTTVIELFDAFLADGGMTLETVPEDIVVKMTYGDNTVEEPFANIYAGFIPLTVDAVALSLRDQLAKYAAVSDLQAAEITLLSKKDGVKGFSVIFGEDFDSESAAIFANGALGHVEELGRTLAKQFGIQSQDDNLIILPGKK